MGRRALNAGFSDEGPKNNLDFVGRNIRTIRREHDLTLSELADQIGIQEGPLGRIERGLNSPSARVIYRLSKAFNLSIDTLFSENDDLFQRRKKAEAEVPYLVDLCGTVDLGKKTLAKIATYFDCERALDTLLGHCPRTTLPIRLSFPATEEGMPRLAREVRGLMGLDENILGLDWFQVMEDLGFRVAQFPFRENIDGLMYFDPKSKNAFFILNAARPQEKCAFKMASELGSLYIWLKSMDGGEPLAKEKATRTAAAVDAFAMELLLPEEAARETVRRIGVNAEAWTYDLLLRLKRRSGIPADRFLKRMEQLDLIGRKPAKEIREKLVAFYAKASAGEPYSCRYSRQPNGALWERLELVATSGRTIEAQDIMEKFNKIALLRK